MRALATVVNRELANDAIQRIATHEDHPVETLGLDGSHESLRKEEPIHPIREVPYDLGHPGGVRVRRRTGDVYPACGDINHEQRGVGDQAASRPHLRREEVGRRDDRSMRLDEGSSTERSARGRSDPVLLQDLGDRGTSNVMIETLQRSLDSAVSPARVLLRHPDDELPDLLHDARSARSDAGTGPLRRDQSAIPSHDGVRRNDRRNSAEKSVTEWLALRCQATALAIREPHGSTASLKLLLQNPVLLDQIADDLDLLASHPSRECREQELEMDCFYNFRRRSDCASAHVTHAIQARSSFRTERGWNGPEKGWSHGYEHTLEKLGASLAFRDLLRVLPPLAN